MLEVARSHTSNLTWSDLVHRKMQMQMAGTLIYIDIWIPTVELGG